ncbi:sporulation protein [Nannocystaceae bacterium ST9]
MGFSDKMRETLGSVGARLTVMSDDEGWAAKVQPGETANAKIRIVGGTVPAKVEALVMRVIIRHRHWTDGRGIALTDAQARELDDRRHLTPAWSRETIQEIRVEVDRDIDAGAEELVEIRVDVPGHCDRTTTACTITLHAQADIRGQIDPTATGKLLVA